MELLTKLLGELGSLSIIAIVFLLGSTFQRLRDIEERLKKLESRDKICETHSAAFEILKSEVTELIKAHPRSRVKD